jgi:hypothetical protein
MKFQWKVPRYLQKQQQGKRQTRKKGQRQRWMAAAPLTAMP